MSSLSHCQWSTWRYNGNSVHRISRSETNLRSNGQPAHLCFLIDLSHNKPIDREKRHVETIEEVRIVVECHHCGTQLPDHSSACTTCGRVIATPGVLEAKRTRIALFLAIDPGFFGFLGLGHIWLGTTNQGMGFMVLGLTLYTATLVWYSFTWPIMTGFWGLVYILLWVRQYRSARRVIRRHMQTVQEEEQRV